MEIDLSHFKKLLKKKREELAELDAIAKDATKPVELDQTTVGRLSRMDAMQGQQMALASARRRQEEVQAIDSALERISTGDYGYCMRCDEEIAHKRLEHNPAALTCIRCAG